MTGGPDFAGAGPQAQPNAYSLAGSQNPSKFAGTLSDSRNLR